MSQQIPERIPGGAMDLSHLAARTAQNGAGPQGSGGGGAPTAPGQAGPTVQPGQTVDIPAAVFGLDDQGFEQAMQLSGIVPVIVLLDQAGRSDAAALERVVRGADGKLVLGKVDIATSPGLTQAFQVQAVPTVVALIAGRPVPLFQGVPPEDQLREVLEKLIELGAQQGLSGRVHAPDLGTEGGDAEAPDEDEGPPINPAHAPALEALERGDFAAAVEAYEQVLLKSPADQEAQAALVQVRLLHRLEGANADEVRRAAADAPDDVEAQLRVADLDVTGGHVEDAFGRLLELFAVLEEADERTAVRERLLELFEAVGTADPRVATARTKLANLLY